jgi:GNAT superfamily N-acetyltransferase
MLNFLKKTWVKKILRAIKLVAVYSYIESRIFINRIAVTVEKDLSLITPLKDSLNQANVKLVEITPDSISQEANAQQALIYSDDKRHPNRRQKAAYYLSKGYRGFALVKENEVLGDMWYVGTRTDNKGILHPDMKWLGIRCGANEAYAFDMYLYPEKRGKNMATLLQNGTLHEMKKDGFKIAFGYYSANYTPALWMHRMLRWKELRRIKVSRFFFICFHFDKVIGKSSGALPTRDGFYFTFVRGGSIV